MTFAAALRSILRSDPTSCWSARSGTERRPPSPSRPPSPATSCCRRCTQRRRHHAHPLDRDGVEPFLVASALDCIVASVWPAACARSARRATSRARPSCRARPGTWRDWGARPSCSGRWAARPAGRPVPRPLRHPRGAHCLRGIERMIVEREHSEDMKKMALARGCSLSVKLGSARSPAGSHLWRRSSGGGLGGR